MDNAAPTRSSQRSRAAARRKVARRRAGAFLFMGAVMFGVGFYALFSLGSWMAGGGVFGGSGNEQVNVPLTLASAGDDFTVSPLVDLREFRDLSYTPVKGLYVTTASSGETFDALIKLADETEINAFVIDVKNDAGALTYKADVALSKQEGLSENLIKDIDATIAKLREHNIIPIARVVCFKDGVLPERRPDLAVQKKNGELWRDRSGMTYTNPYNREVWEYLVQVAEDAARHGFREIQFDYVRFPSEGDISEAVFPGENSSKEDTIAAFLAYARPRLEKLGVWVSADVFGVTVNPAATKDSQTIGQSIEKMSQYVDIVCPMVYPSHYNDGYYDIESPNRQPHDLVTRAMSDTAKRLAGSGAMGRPWLQDFSLGGVKYGINEVKAQIKAAEEQGFSEWLLWDPGLTYTEGALRRSDG